MTLYVPVVEVPSLVIISVADGGEHLRAMLA